MDVLCVVVGKSWSRVRVLPCTVVNRPCACVFLRHFRNSFITRNCACTVCLFARRNDTWAYFWYQIKYPQDNKSSFFFFFYLSPPLRGKRRNWLAPCTSPTLTHRARLFRCGSRLEYCPSWNVTWSWCEAHEEISLSLLSQASLRAELHHPTHRKNFFAVLLFTEPQETECLFMEIWYACASPAYFSFLLSASNPLKDVQPSYTHCVYKYVT